jgi:DNA-binding transcriptional MocR family regulator
MRINFSYSNNNDIETGVKRLSDVIREELKGI